MSVDKPAASSGRRGLRRFLFSWLPESFRDRHRARWYAVRDEIVWRLKRPEIPRPADGKRRLHLGCGSVDVPGWINVDVRPGRHVHYRCDVGRLPMLPDASMDLVYCSHCLEHISHRDVPAVLAEWHRLLAPGGILRLSVPDFQTLLRAYAELGNDLEAIQNPLMGGQDYPANFHHSMFDEAYLSKLLLAAGFGIVRRWEPDPLHREQFNDHSWRDIELKGRKFQVSLNLEAAKHV